MRVSADTQVFDVAVIGAGAAGLATAIFAARAAPRLKIVLLDGAQKIGAKILVAGGGRCNVTNSVVTAEDYNGGSSTIVRRVLQAFPVSLTVAFFREIGVLLHEEPNGKLFPNTNSGRDVLAALVGEAGRLGVVIRTNWRVKHLETQADGRYLVAGAIDRVTARTVVLACGGMSLPKSGSDGAGYDLAKSLGHTVVPTTPGLAPLVLAGDFHQGLSGVALPAELTISGAGKRPVRLVGDLLWTHFGISGPVALNASRHWLRSKLEGENIQVTANFQPGRDFQTVERTWLTIQERRPTATTRNVLSALLPTRMADAMLATLSQPPEMTLSHLDRDTRRAIIRAIVEWPLPIRDSRGYNYAEVTAGGVRLTEINPGSMESRLSPGLYLVGEILDVDGYIGGFNFQWAWSSAFVAGRAIAARG